MPVTILFSEDLKEYDFGPGHPFRGDRYLKFLKFLREHLPEDSSYQVKEADYASEEELLLISTEDYIRFTRDYYRAAHMGTSYPGPFFQYHSGDNAVAGRPGRLEEAARLVVGQARTGCDLILSGETDKAVSIGGGLHHAKPSYGEGFCLYNDVAFAASYLIQKYRLDRILILDTDAHAGNGTAEYFYDSPNVLLIDLHQDPSYLYPGTGFVHQIGSGAGKGFTINIPLPMYAGLDSYRAVFEEIAEPVTAEFRPQIIIRNGGSDPHFGDMLTSLALPVAGFRMIGRKVRQMSEVCGGRVLDLIASGYNMDVLPYAWLALITGLAGLDTAVEEPGGIPERFRADSASSETASVIEQVKRHHRPYWKALEE
ncbi:MAG: hypothetical protein IBX68_07325 [Dehalococcoidia bacterium]|nr:hypothetical protein [Dehalococcoidia bacterium]